MESSASTRVLQEPALLYLVLCQLSQGELLIVQRVCQTWKRTISDDRRLLKMMWLHPGSPVTNFDVDTTRINPLLRRTFPTIFDSCNFEDGFAETLVRHSPFNDMYVRKSPQVLKILKFPNSSWRRMIPCSPAPDQLLVSVPGEERGKLMWLNFSNRNVQDAQKSRPPWLTFGLLYDIAECAWHQGDPWRLHGITFDFPSASLERRRWHEFIPLEALIPDQLRALARSRAGLVRLRLQPDIRSEAERRKLHDELVAQQIRQRDWNARWGWCGTNFIVRNEIFTDEFHFTDALPLDEIRWDDICEYDMPLRETSTPQPSPPRRRLFGMRIGRRR
ncbi:uncharacterized protein RHO25_011562 [Cercospora beticola]|uniref:F-box domain-containing protein n=1 Tax=Cercospora beticola TaxID=122368 RepID=A0ABZ0P5F2_CERBT|nr:hypothetical protein RHO25_011562 [Cercospora beticola]CAK1366827.1 unnamed protein product [Cercospora beticola]